MLVGRDSEFLYFFYEVFGRGGLVGEGREVIGKV